ncbi:hypothetical protein Baya_5259 [Bagarius yarrelli]|uniref:Uncharacterized protein n=1 Tax=Bagarius yarrelli TaxID=175774 RepID=A0A556TU40_BAGYA|nr:hypothetical protein Baya_5259 [Bagarius yarrelli]
MLRFVAQDDTACLSVKEERKSYRRPSITSASAKMGNADPDAFIQGMEGYQWTDADLEFVYQARQQKQVRQLQQELSEIEKTLQAETQRLELAVASRDQLRSELSKTLSCDSLLQLCKSVLSRSRTSDQLDGLGDKALLLLLDLPDVQQAVREEKTQVRRLEREAQELREKEEIDTYQQKISSLQEASKAAQLRREVRKAEVISYALEETETEEMNTSQIPEIKSKVPAKGRKAARSVRSTTKTLKEKVLKGTSEKITASMKKVDKEKVEEGEAATKEKASKKMTSKKTAKKDILPEKMATTATPLQVKTSIERDPENMTTKLTNVAEVLKKSRQGSKITKASSMTPKDKAQKKTTLKDPKENEMVSMVTADKEMTKEGKSTPKKKTLRKTLKKDLVPDETDAALSELPTKVNASNVAQVLEKGRKGSQTAEPSARARRERTALRKTGEEETVKIEADEKGKTSRKVKAPKKVRAKKTAEKELSPDVMVPKTNDAIVSKETVSTVQAQEMMTFKTDPKRKKLKDTETVSKKSADMEMPTELTGEAATVTKEMTLKVRSQRKTSKQKEVNDTTSQETVKDDSDLKKGLKEASKKKSTMKNKIKEPDPEETTSEKILVKKVAEETTTAKTTRNRRAAKFKAPEETPERETALQETRKRAAKPKATNQRAGKKSSEDEASTNAAQPQEEAVKSSKSPAERDPGPIRRSKRNTVKSENLSSANPKKTTRSR